MKHLNIKVTAHFDDSLLKNILASNVAIFWDIALCSLYVNHF
jgi:hypothetical protein